MSYTARHGPIDPAILPLCDPDYAAYYAANIEGGVALDYTAPFDPSIRSVPLGSGNSVPLECITENVKVGECEVRVFTPLEDKEGKRPAEGWPVVVYFHGGGWVLGSVDSEISVATQLCRRTSLPSLAPLLLCQPPARPDVMC
jgi:acetyl esterase/lipase